MNEILRDNILRIAAEAARDCAWMEFEAADASAHLVAGDIRCFGDRVEFEADSGSIDALAYGAIRAIRTGRQGEPGGGRVCFVPTFAAELAA